jgi:hypothetical protein
LKTRDGWWFCVFDTITFGGFVCLTSFWGIFFHIQYSLSLIAAGNFATLCAAAGWRDRAAVHRDGLARDDQRVSVPARAVAQFRSDRRSGRFGGFILLNLLASLTGMTGSFAGGLLALGWLP